MRATEEERSRIGAWALGRWQLQEHLGSGGMSTVYGAVHRTNGKRVAIKVLHPHLASMPEAVERFLGEGCVANQVDHPGVVSVFDDGTMDDGALCLVMDKLVGGSLDQWLQRRGALPVLETILVLDRLLDILVAAHRAGVIHRDVKPDNVFVTAAGCVKLLDFGIARNIASSSTTQTGAIMGTPAYMPPEQAEGRWTEVDARADVFAAGAVAIALLAGKAPRVGPTANLTLLAAMSHPLEGVRSRGLDVPPAVADVIERAIAWRREDRYPSASAMVEALRAAWYASCRVRLDGHDGHLAPVGRMLATPVAESAPADPDSTEAMPMATRTIVERVSPVPDPSPSHPTSWQDWHERLRAAITLMRRSFLGGRASTFQMFAIAVAAAMAVALVTGVALAQVLAPEPRTLPPPPPTPVASAPAASTVSPPEEAVDPLPAASATVPPAPSHKAGAAKGSVKPARRVSP